MLGDILERKCEKKPSKSSMDIYTFDGHIISVYILEANYTLDQIWG